MIKGKRIYLRMFKQQDLDIWIEHVNNFDYKGDYLPLDMTSQVEIHKQFNENGLWTEDYSRMLICENETDRMLGYIVYFKTTRYITGLEIGYTIFDPADRGKGYCSEALTLMTEWLFLSKQITRLQVGVDSENISSRKAAEKCGYIYEGTLRMATYSRGKYNDLLLLSMTRPEFEKRQSEK
jgi:RimJ/RimL family protein N-acetyltransferase